MLKLHDGNTYDDVNKRKIKTESICYRFMLKTDSCRIKVLLIDTMFDYCKYIKESSPKFLQLKIES